MNYWKPKEEYWRTCKYCGVEYLTPYKSGHVCSQCKKENIIKRELKKKRDWHSSTPIWVRKVRVNKIKNKLKDFPEMEDKKMEELVCGKNWIKNVEEVINGNNRATS